MRTFMLSDLVTLPRLNAVDAFTLTQSLLSAAESERTRIPQRKLPGSITRALTVLAGRQEVLRARLAPQPPPGARSDPRKEDRAEDSAVLAIRGWASAFARLDVDSAERSTAITVGALFADDGTNYLRGDYRQEWAKVQVALDALEKAELQGAMRRMGAGLLLDQLLRAHEAYGMALGVTRPLPLPAETPAVRPEFLALLQALRRYVLMVVAHDAADEASGSSAPDAASTGDELGALAQGLLRPLLEWVTSHPSAATAALEPSASTPPAATGSGGSGP